MKTFDDSKKSGSPQPAPEDPIKDLTSMEEAEMYGNGPDAPAERLSNNAVKGGAWLLGIVGVFAVALVVALLVGEHNGPLSSRSEARQEMALSQPQQPLNPGTLAPQTAYQFVAVLIPSQGAGSGNVAAAQSKASAAASSVTASASATSDVDASRIEREAREVIHGDFGDNPGRREKLGADYAAVQARVNQILN